MARPRGFDEEAAVHRATDVFWRKGFHATSTRDLNAALELNPSSLYRTFGDKRRLFLRALDHYRATESADGCQRFRDADPTRDALTDAVATVALGSDAHATDPAGCFVINTAAEMGGTDPEIARRTETAFNLTRTGLGDLLTRMRESGEISVESDLDELTDLLFTLVLGWRLRARAGHDPSDIRSSIEHTIALLG
ncbi:TetR/AcrR family transcriptional regulator [Nocardia wallacei]|uniref:TetR/AcrR family transcriptional regulator n=1 Tax=Nocardia wallacei TaxID=480035 RepID=UPI002453E68C|nr:TetR/AcrR family transcriptional regulator [Nocardia wallacei]